LIPKRRSNFKRVAAYSYYGPGVAMFHRDGVPPGGPDPLGRSAVGVRGALLNRARARCAKKESLRLIATGNSINQCKLFRHCWKKFTSCSEISQKNAQNLQFKRNKATNASNLRMVLELRQPTA
jgi:hypothetical protein